MYGDAATGFNLDGNFGLYDLNDRYVYDLARPNVIDSGALRWVGPRSFADDESFDSGQYEYNVWNLQENVEVVVQQSGNVTIQTAFNVVDNATVSVRDGAILSVKEGNATCLGTFQISRNSTVSYRGSLTFGANSTLSLLDVRNVTFSGLILTNQSEFTFGDVNRPMRISERGVFAGQLNIMLTTRPIARRGMTRTTQTVQVANFPAGAATGTFASTVVTASYPGSQCDSTVATPTTSSSTLSVTLTTTNVCTTTSPGGTTGPSTSGGGLSTGAIIGIAVGAAVGAALIVIIILLIRKRAQDKKKVAMNQQFRKRTVDEADKMKMQMQKDENEAADRRKRESVKMEDGDDRRKRESAKVEEGVMVL